MIDRVAKVVVPVDDQPAALAFWTERAGFDVTRDETYGDERWIEVAPPGERGVEFTAPPARMHFGWWALFRDQDGTRYALAA